MTSLPFEVEAGSRRILASLDDIRGPSANGRDTDHVTTSRQAVKSKVDRRPDDWRGGAFSNR